MILKKSGCLCGRRIIDAEGLDAVHFSKPLNQITKTCKFRGSVIIALEDNKYDTHSFHFKEDLDNVFAEISDLTGGLIRRG